MKEYIIPDDFLDYEVKASADGQGFLRELVRCRECKHRYVDGDNVRYNVCELNHNKVQSDDWFCADGKRKDNER